MVSTAFLSPLVRGTSIPALQNIRLNRIHRPIAKSDGHRFPEFSPNTSAPHKKETEYWVFIDFLLPNPLYDFLLSIPPTPSSLEPSAAPRKIRFELKSSGNRRFFSSPTKGISSVDPIRSCSRPRSSPAAAALGKQRRRLDERSSSALRGRRSSTGTPPFPVHSCRAEPSACKLYALGSDPITSH